MLRAFTLPLALCLSLGTAHAQEAPPPADPLDRLFVALGMPDILEIMRLEGLEYGQELSLDLLGVPNHAGWAQMVAEIYRTPRLEEVVRGALAEDLAGADVGAMLDFFESDLGAEIIALELSARSAMLAPEVDAMARAALADLIADEDPRLDLLEAFSDANQLVENNVGGAMNSNFAFYVGLSEGGAFGEAFSEEEILRDVWSQEPAIRIETEEWLMSYIALAYQPLTDAELAAYVAFSETEPGQVLNRAIFDAFDAMYGSVSLALGAAAAQFMAGQEL